MKRGTRVVCIDAGNMSMLSEGEIYTVHGVIDVELPYKGKAITLVEAQPPQPFDAFDIKRFAEVDETLGEIKTEEIESIEYIN